VGSDAAPVVDLLGITQDQGNSNEATLSGSFEDIGCSPVDAFGFEISSSPTFEPHETYWANGGPSLFTATISVAPNTTYWIRAFAEYRTLIAYSGAQSWTSQAFSCPTSFLYQGHDYPVVQVGDQCWFAENLRVTQYNDGTSITSVNSNNMWMQQISGAYCEYGNNNSYVETYGRLYNWYAASNDNICPDGWHVPTDFEWQQMEAFIGLPIDTLDWWGFDRGRSTNSGGKLKSTSGWTPPNTGATNSVGFNGSPGGWRIGDPTGQSGTPGNFTNEGIVGAWWTRSEFDGEQDQGQNIPPDPVNKGWSRYLRNTTQGISRFDTYKTGGQSIRCIKN